MHMVRAAKEDKILKWLCKYDSNLIMFHHRNPTSTINVKRAAHPFSTKDYFGDSQYILVHNGVVTNADELFVDHQELGIDYYSLLDDLTFNDSEALLWDLALTLEGKQPEMKARGGIAFVCVKLVDGVLDKLYFGRNSSPLNMFRHEDGLALSSEGEGESIDPQVLYTFNYKLKRLTQKTFKIPSYFTQQPYSYTPTYSRDRPGNWLPENVKNNPKVRSYLDKQYDNQIYDYDRDGNPLFESDYDYNSRFYLPSTEILDMEEEEELELYRASDSQVESKALEYLMAAKGVFEVAYWKAEFDYGRLVNADLNVVEDFRDMLLMEDVLEYIESDPEYVNDKSVSSIWRALWEQQNLAA